METITATDLARNTRGILDKVAHGGQTVVVERNQVLIATISPAQPTMNAAQALQGLPNATLSAAQAQAWLSESRGAYDDAVQDPWG